MAGDKKINTTKSKKKRKRFPYRKLVYILMALVLVGGIVLSAAMGLIDYLKNGDQVVPAEHDEQLAGLLHWISSLEESLQDNPNAENKAKLGEAYFELAFYCSEQGLEDYETYAAASKELLSEAVDEGILEPGVTLRIALLALLQEDDAQAEKYFRTTLDLDENYAEAHFYYAVFLSAKERAEIAKTHFEKVIELETEDSPLAQTAQYYLNLEG